MLTARQKKVTLQRVIIDTTGGPVINRHQTSQSMMKPPSTEIDWPVT